MLAIKEKDSESSYLIEVLGLESSSWMMAPSERLALLGIITLLQPKSVLELGCGNGGLTKWLAQFIARVTAVDLDPKIEKVCRGLRNVTPLCMTTADAFAELARRQQCFDLVIIDADHSTEGARRDLTAALDFADIVILHDTFNPDCRAGYQMALAAKNVYANLDLVEGGLQADGLWGGLGIVLNRLPSNSESFVTRRVSFFGLMQRRQSRKLLRDKIRQIPMRFRRGLGALVRRKAH